MLFITWEAAPGGWLSLAGLGLSALATGGKTLDKMIKILCGGDMRVGEGGTLFYWKNTEYFGGLAGWLALRGGVTRKLEEY